MKTYTKEELDKKLESHVQWLTGEIDGQHLDLERADLEEACLKRANLKWANLAKADLRRADLRGATLRGANLKGASLPNFQLCPEEGSFVAWKKAGKQVVKLLIPENAKRTSNLVGRKCRAEFVDVLEISGGGKIVESVNGGIYEVANRTFPDKYCDDIRIECSHGIHFFITKKEAEDWG